MPRAKGKKMRITLNQAEIELALQNFVKSKLTVKDGIGMNIDLKATRGQEGYTAEIDLTGDNAEVGLQELATATGRTQQQQPQAAVATPVATQPQVLNSNGPVEQPAAPTTTIQPVYPNPEQPVGEKPPVDATEQPFVEPTESAAELATSGDNTAPAGSQVDTQEKVAVARAEQEAGPVAADTPAVAAEPAPQPVSDQVTEAPRKPVVGLFANLKKPVNPAS